MFDYIIRVAMQDVDRFPERIRWPVLGGSLLTLLGYADDLALTARDMTALVARMKKFDDICTRAGMTISTKTKLMHINPPSEDGSPSATSPHPSHTLHLSHFTVDVVDRFTYLGSDVNTHLDLTSTIQDRLDKAGAVFARLSRLWSTSHLSTSIKAKMYHSLVRPVALYGAETWTLLPSMEHLVDATEMRWLRQLARISLRQELHNGSTPTGPLPHPDERGLQASPAPLLRAPLPPALSQLPQPRSTSEPPRTAPSWPPHHHLAGPRGPRCGHAGTDQGGPTAASPGPGGLPPPGSPSTPGDCPASSRRNPVLTPV